MMSEFCSFLAITVFCRVRQFCAKPQNLPINVISQNFAEFITGVDKSCSGFIKLSQLISLCWVCQTHSLSLLCMYLSKMWIYLADKWYLSF